MTAPQSSAGTWASTGSGLGPSLGDSGGLGPWRLLVADGVGAAEGLALDEALMAGYRRAAPPRPPTLRLYTYKSYAALVGRYQHLEAELDLGACRRHGTGVNRRPTGGGAIVMGEGQLGVAVVARAPSAETPRELLQALSGGIVAGLAGLGVDARFRGKNDLEACGKKIAGLGLYLDGEGAMLFHSSILADLDVAFMLEVLRIPAAKLGDKGVAAVRDRVTTVTDQTGRSWTGGDLRDAIGDGFEKALRIGTVRAETDAEEEELARVLAAEKYSSHEWLHQRSPHPDATGSSVLKTPVGLLRLYLALNGSTIKSALFTGDFNEVPAALTRLEAALRWKRLDREDLERITGEATAGDAELAVSPGVLAAAVLEAGERALARAGSAPVRPEGSCYFPEMEGAVHGD